MKSNKYACVRETTTMSNVEIKTERVVKRYAKWIFDHSDSEGLDHGDGFKISYIITEAQTADIIT